MVISVGTGKDGKDIAKAICLSIKQQNPDYIFFILSGISQERTMPLIRENIAVHSQTSEERLLSDENNVEQIEIECVAFLKELLAKGILPGDIIIDFTSGTKAMSVGIVLAALNWQGITLSYITGRRNHEGRVISGEEVINIQTPNRIFFNSMFKDSVYLFNRYQFETCFDLISEAKNLLSDVEYLQKADTLGKLAQAYSFWEKFDQPNAFQILKDLTAGLASTKYLLEWGIKSVVEKNKQILYQEKENNYSPERVVDLLENASRRAEEGKFDDAVARLYRLMEYLAQYQLFNKYQQIKTESLEVNKLPVALQLKYNDLKNKDGKVTISLYQAYDLLKELNDELGKKFISRYNEKDSKIKKLLGIRNNSILAHGFGSIHKEHYQSLISTVDDYVKIAVDNDELLKKNIKFPKVKIS